MADGQKDYLQGTIEFYQARTNTKMTIAAERLAVIAAVTLPITALSSILGMNLIVNEDDPTRTLLAVALVDHADHVHHAADLGQAQGLVVSLDQHCDAAGSRPGRWQLRCIRGMPRKADGDSISDGGTVRRTRRRARRRPRP